MFDIDFGPLLPGAFWTMIALIILGFLRHFIAYIIWNVSQLFEKDYMKPIYKPGEYRDAAGHVHQGDVVVGYKKVNWFGR